MAAEELARLLVYLVRHAIAEDRDPRGESDDAMRRLTPQGIDRMRQHVQALARLGIELDAIWTSPLTRAVETAELLAELHGFRGRLERVDELAGGGAHDRLIERIASFRGDGLALVGHEPDMGELAAMLIFGSPDGSIRFKKGGVACIALDPDADRTRGELKWLLTPKQLRQIG